jgi:hypothetical protein
MNAIEDIAAERRRQVEVEGWTPEHDDNHRDGSMAAAAACYAFFSRMGEGTREVSKFDTGNLGFDPIRRMWPMSWSSQWWKPTDRRRDLVKAGALIVAEIERLDRAAKPST